MTYIFFLLYICQVNILDMENKIEFRVKFDNMTLKIKAKEDIKIHDLMDIYEQIGYVLTFNRDVLRDGFEKKGIELYE